MQTKYTLLRRQIVIQEENTNTQAHTHTNTHTHRNVHLENHPWLTDPKDATYVI